MRMRSFALIAVMSLGLASANAEPPRTKLAQFFGQRCQTGQGWCFMSVPGPVGAPCWCPSPYGPVQGFIVQ